MSEITYYAIRERGTDKYIHSNGRRGTTQSEPVQVGRYPYAIRLFLTEMNAKRALTAWRRGSFWLGRHGEICVSKEPERLLKDMEVVPVTMILPNP